MELLRELILWAALGYLGLMFAGLALSAATSATRWSDLLAGAKGASATLTRTGFLFGNLGLAITFLLAVLESGGDPDRLRNTTEVFRVLDITALTGTASGAYLWSKLTGRSD